MADSTTESILTTTAGLLTYYCYEVGGQTQESLLDRWLGDYSPEWVRLALIESLYRGRYKTISVGGLLADWKRRGQPIYHFNREFEALICHKFPHIRFTQELLLSADHSRQKRSTVDEVENLEYLPAEPTSTVEEVVNTHTVAPPVKRSSQIVEADTGSDLDIGATDVSHKLWSLVANIAPNKTIPSPSNDDLNDPFSKSSADSSPTMAWDKKPQKHETAPIDKFTPNREFSDHYQKLVAMISNQSNLYEGSFLRTP